MDAQDEQDFGIDSRKAREEAHRHICLLSNVGAALCRDWGEAVSWDRGSSTVIGG